MKNNTKINILDITYYMICPPISGGALRMIAPFTRMNSDCGLSVDFLFSTYSDEHAEQCREYLEQFPVINSATGVVTLMYNWFTGGKPEYISPDVYTTISKELRDKAEKMVREKHYDIIQIEHSQLSWIVPFLRLASPESKIVLDLHNAEYLIFERWLPYAIEEEYESVKNKYKTMYNWEKKVWNWYDAVLTVSPVEEKLFREVTGNDNTFLVPTGGGIDIDKYAPGPGMEKPYELLYLGTMNWFPNAHGMLWFLDEVFPRVLEKRPETRLNIAGFGDPSNELCRRAMAHPNITFLGQVENDVELFQKSKVFIVPLWIGAGARVKIPTAWASKLPVVSTTLGAEGEEAIHGQNIILADSGEAFADGILRLIDDERYAAKLAENAFDLVSRKYSLQYCADLLVENYHKIAGSCI